MATTGTVHRDELAELAAAITVQKQRIQTIFKSQDFSAMPAAQQLLAQLQERLKLLRLTGGQGDGATSAKTRSPPGYPPPAPTR